MSNHSAVWIWWRNKPFVLLYEQMYAKTGQKLMEKIWHLLSQFFSETHLNRRIALALAASRLLCITGLWIDWSGSSHLGLGNILCCVLLGQDTLIYLCLSNHPGVNKWVPANQILGVTLHPGNTIGHAWWATQLHDIPVIRKLSLVTALSLYNFTRSFRHSSNVKLFMYLT